MTTKNDATALPAELAAELAGLKDTLRTYEQRVAAVNGNGGIRSRFNSRLARLRSAHSLGQVLCMNIGRDISRQCDTFMLEVLPPADSGKYVGFPRTV